MYNHYSIDIHIAWLLHREPEDLTDPSTAEMSRRFVHNCTDMTGEKKKKKKNAAHFKTQILS